MNSRRIQDRDLPVGRPNDLAKRGFWARWFAPAVRLRIGLLGVSFGLTGLAVAFTLLALSRQVSFYRTPSDVVAQPPGVGVTFRLGGMVEVGSLSLTTGDPGRQGENSVTRFAVTDGSARVVVAFLGELPSLFEEGRGVVADGRWNDSGEFVASRVLAKHDETYRPPGSEYADGGESR